MDKGPLPAKQTLQPPIPPSRWLHKQIKDLFHVSRFDYRCGSTEALPHASQKVDQIGFNSLVESRQKPEDGINRFPAWPSDIEEMQKMKHDAVSSHS